MVSASVGQGVRCLGAMLRSCGVLGFLRQHFYHRTGVFLHRIQKFKSACDRSSLPKLDITVIHDHRTRKWGSHDGVLLSGLAASFVLLNG